MWPAARQIQPEASPNQLRWWKWKSFNAGKCLKSTGQMLMWTFSFSPPLCWPLYNYLIPPPAVIPTSSDFFSPPASVATANQFEMKTEPGFLLPDRVREREYGRVHSVRRQHTQHTVPGRRRRRRTWLLSLSTALSPLCVVSLCRNGVLLALAGFTFWGESTTERWWSCLFRIWPRARASSVRLW